jgi:hypothetical protein
MGQEGVDFGPAANRFTYQLTVRLHSPRHYEKAKKSAPLKAAGHQGEISFYQR